MSDPQPPLGVTELLESVRQGDRKAAADLLPIVYDELRRLAHRRLAQEGPGQTLQATALVHEAYLRLVGPEDEQRWDNRGHFFAAAAEAMRRILVESYRRKQTLKRGGTADREALDDAQLVTPQPHDDLVALDEALDRLGQIDAAKAELVKLRFFAGLTLAEAAQAMGIAPATADRYWAYAKAWLYEELRPKT